MNFNYKTAFFLSLGILIFSWILFAGYLILTLVTFMDAGKSNLITNHDCADGDYCALNPENMPDGGWTGMDDKTIPPSEPMDEMTDGYTPGSKVDASTLYQNTDFRFRFDLRKGEQALPCPYPVENYVSIEIVNQTEPITNLDVACAREGFQEYISVDKSGAGPIGFAQFVFDNYKFTTEKKMISGFEGTRYIGTKLPEADGPIPDKIDTTVLQTEHGVYTITSDFYDRNVFIW